MELILRMQNTDWDDTIVALATAQGLAAIGVIRISGKNAFPIMQKLFSKNISNAASHTIHLGFLQMGTKKLDEVLVAKFKNPTSYTGEDVIEISCHGSPFIQQQIINAITENGARLAKAGEFTQRAFLNGKLDLTQAEAVADVIASETESAKQTALQQMKGGFSNDIKILRQQLIEFAALIELELDFSEEDVEFADRSKLKILIEEILIKIKALIQSFQLGNIIKNGVTTVIAGRPNAGKSTLLNALLNEERAIVTNIAGTTRDTIEEKLIIDGLVFRLIDTAGIREATDVIEKIGIEKTLAKISTAEILIYVFDINTNSELEVLADLKQLQKPNQKIVLVANKIDTFDMEHYGMLNYSINEMNGNDFPIFPISALNKTQISDLLDYLPNIVLHEKVNTNQTIVVNTRHYNALQLCQNDLQKVQTALNTNITGDWLALDIRHALQTLGEITGEILHDKDILGTIFGKFCIGK
jgi:tRNA modification GTPase